MANVAQHSTERKSRPQTGDSLKIYCWTYDRAFNPVHTTDTYNNRADKYKEEVAWGTKMEGSDKDYTMRKV